MSRRIAVAGGGAAGMMAAIQAARTGAQVTIYERNDRVGKKILSTGNGKCNFSNEVMDVSYYCGSGKALIESVYHIFGVEETKAFFAGLGMRMKNRNGYLYPASEQASTVLDVLRYELEHLKITIHTNRRVDSIVRCDAGLRVETPGHESKIYDAVILACGGRAAPKTGSDGAGFRLAKELGHRIVPTVPALAALRCKEDYFKRVAGVRCDAVLTLRIDGQPVRREQGELQWTDYGISGIPVFQLCRDAAYGLRGGKCVTVEIRLLLDDGEHGKEQEDDGWNGKERIAGCCWKDKEKNVDAQTFWADRWNRQASQTMEQFVTGLVNKKIGLLLLKLAGIRETDVAKQVPMALRRKLEGLFYSLTVTVKETNSYEQAQVCAGGVDCAEVTKLLESRLVPGLFFAGEILDIDGMCGGYNLQWAWSSGSVAGCAAAVGEKGTVRL